MTRSYPLINWIRALCKFQLHYVVIELLVPCSEGNVGIQHDFAQNAHDYRCKSHTAAKLLPQASVARDNQIIGNRHD